MNATPLRVTGTSATLNSTRLGLVGDGGSKGLIKHRILQKKEVLRSA